MKAMICLLDGNIDFPDIFVGVMQINMLTPYLFITYFDSTLWMSEDIMKVNDLTLKKPGSRKYPAETITEADYTNDLVLLANTLVQAKLLLYSL